METFEILKDIISESMPEIDVNNVTRDTLVKEDLGLDSLSMMMIAMQIEEQFGFEFDGEIKFNTVGDICDYVDSMKN